MAKYAHDDEPMAAEGYPSYPGDMDTPAGRSQLHALHEQIDELSKAVDTLIGRLDPVLTPPGPTVVADDSAVLKQSASSSDLTMRLRRANDQINEMATRVVRVVHRLEI